MELRLLECVGRGEWLDLVQDESRDGAETRWEALYELDASIIRDLLRGRLVADPDPHGVRVRGVRLRGILDLEGLSTTVNLQLRDSFLPDGVDASGARLNVLRLDGCEVRSASGPAIAAERLIASELTLVGAVLIGHGAAGAVSLRGAHLDRLICDDARLSNDSGPALRADSLRVDQEVLLRGGFEASGSGELGAVYLLGARTARLECDGANLCNASGPALRADSIQVDQRAFLWRGFTASGSGELGAVRLNGSRIGIFSVRGSAISNGCGPALITVAAHIATVDNAATIGVITRSAGRRTAIDTAFAAAPHVPCRRWDLAIDDPHVRDRIRRIVAGLPRGATVDDARREALAAIAPSDVDTAEELDNAFDQLAEQDGGDASVRQVLARYRHTDDDDEIAVGPGVHLLNAHTGKGQQFDWIFVCGLEQGQVPNYFAKTQAAVAEEQRVLLVMLSRARHGVIVTRSRNAHGKHGPFEVNPSPWFPALQSAATMTGQQLINHINALYPDDEEDE